MNRKRALLIAASLFVALATSLTLLWYTNQMQEKSSTVPECIVIKSAELTYEGGKPILYLRVANVGEAPVKIVMVYLYYEVSELSHLVGSSAYVGVTEYKVDNPLIVLYGSNPIPPNQETQFKAVLGITAKYLDEYGHLKPGNYLVRAVSEKDTEAFYTIKISGVNVKTSLQNYLYRGNDLVVYLKVKNIGDTPFIPSRDIKVYVNGKPWKVFYDENYVVASEEEKLIEIIIPLLFVPYNNVTREAYPYVDLEKHTIVNLAPNPEFTVSMLMEHGIVIDVLGTKFEIRVPPINMSCKILNVEKTVEKDARGQSWCRVTSVTMEVISQWLTRPDLGWFNKIEICSENNLCEDFIVYDVEFTQKSSETYIVTIYPSLALYPVSEKKFVLHIYYGELKVASINLS